MILSWADLIVIAMGIPTGYLFGMWGGFRRAEAVAKRELDELAEGLEEWNQRHAWGRGERAARVARQKVHGGQESALAMMADKEAE